MVAKNRKNNFFDRAPKKLGPWYHVSLYMKIAIKQPNLVWFSNFSWLEIVWLNFFAGNGFSTFRNGGIDTKNLKIGPNLAILDKCLYFLLKSYTLHSKVALEKIQNCPKTAKFGPIFKFFVSVPPFLMVLNRFWAKKFTQTISNQKYFENQTKFGCFRAIFIYNKTWYHGPTF